LIVSYNNETKKFFCISSFAEKDIPKSAGFKWNPKDKQWQTGDISVAEKLSTYFTDSTRQQIKELKCDFSKTEELSSALSSDISVPCPDGLSYMPFQKAGIEFVLNKKNVLLGDDQGTGKTIMSIGTLNILSPRYVLIVCPSTPKINWYREYNKWSIYKKSVAVIKDKWITADVVIINYDKLEKFSGINDIVLEEISFEYFLHEYKPFNLLSDVLKKEKIIDISKATKKDVKNVFNKLISIPKLKDLFKQNKGLSCVEKKKVPTNKQIISNKEFLLQLYPKTLKNIDYKNYLTERVWDVIVCDEAHRIKNPKTIRYKCLKEIECNKKIALTGTPIKIRPISIWNILKWLEVSWADNWIDFVTRYCDGYQDRFGWKVNGASNTIELNNKLRSTCMIRRLKSEVMKDLPPKTRQIVEIESEGFLDSINKEKELAKSKRTKIKELKQKQKETQDETEYKKIAEQLKECRMQNFNNLSVVRHELAIKKIPYVIEHLSDLVESANKIVVFAHHRDVIESIEKQLTELGFKCVVLMGGMTDAKKQEVIDAFQLDDTVTFFIGSIMACGEAITLTKSSTCVFVELDWDVGAITQAEDRLHRHTQVNNVLIQHIVVNGSIDARMIKKMVKTQEIIDTALNKKENIVDSQTSPSTNLSEESWEEMIPDEEFDNLCC
jgi:SNF2 family DNA or RNA helicase